MLSTSAPALRGASPSIAARPRAHPPSRSTPPWPSDHGRLGGVNLEGSGVRQSKLPGELAATSPDRSRAGLGEKGWVRLPLGPSMWNGGTRPRDVRSRVVAGARGSGPALDQETEPQDNRRSGGRSVPDSQSERALPRDMIGA